MSSASTEVNLSCGVVIFCTALSPAPSMPFMLPLPRLSGGSNPNS
jgi:hypothetical protein